MSVAVGVAVGVSVGAGGSGVGVVFHGALRIADEAGGADAAGS